MSELDVIIISLAIQPCLMHSGIAWGWYAEDIQLSLSTPSDLSGVVDPSDESLSSGCAVSWAE